MIVLSCYESYEFKKEPQINQKITKKYLNKTFIV